MKLLDNIPMIRVITGSAKNKKLVVPEIITRPLTDRIRISLFDTLRDFVIDANVLDLFAGSGSFGIEALSRGAQHATFIDKHEEAIAAINENLINTKFTEKATLLKVSAKQFLAESEAHFELIFIDPPFGFPTSRKIQLLTQASKLLVEKGVVVMRCPLSDTLPSEVIIDGQKAICIIEKKYGESQVFFYQLG